MVLLVLSKDRVLTFNLFCWYLHSVTGSKGQVILRKDASETFGAAYLGLKLGRGTILLPESPFQWASSAPDSSPL